jgi:hypothetical protein
VGVVEEALAGAEQRRHQVKLHLVDETGVQVLLRGPRTARERDMSSDVRHGRMRWTAA